MFSGLARGGFEEFPLPGEFAERIGSKDIALRASEWRTSGGTSARYALIRGRQVEVFNLMVFPADPDGCPLFVAEVVHFGDKVRVVLIDHQAADPQCALQKTAGSLLDSVLREFSGFLTTGKDMPEWSMEHASTGCLFAHPASPDETAVVEKAFAAYWNFWLDRWQDTVGIQVRNQQSVREYCCDHLKNYPGRPFLANIFGAEWTEQFLSKFLYAPLSDPRHHSMASPYVEHSTQPL